MAIRKGNSPSGGALSALPGKTSGSIRSLVTSAGFVGNGASIAVAVAMAESGGNAQASHTNTDGSTDRGLWQINNHAHPDVSDACAYDPLCCAKAAYKISNGGSDWGAWTTFNSGAYRQYLTAGDFQFHSSTGINTALSANAGSVSGVAGGGSSATVGAAAQGAGGAQLQFGSVFSLAASDVADFIFDAFIKFPAILIGDYLLIPAWHWNQRAVAYYTRDLTQDKAGVMTLSTAVFWSFGYVLLWGDPDKFKLHNPRSWFHKARTPSRTHLARHTRNVQSLPSRRRLTKPKDVKGKTSVKPEPRFSSVKVMQVGTMSTHRKERVTVSGTANGHSLHNQQEDSSERFTVKRDGDLNVKPDAERRSGLRTSTRGSDWAYSAPGANGAERGRDTGSRTHSGNGNRRP